MNVFAFAPAAGDHDADDLRQNNSTLNPFPPEFYVCLLRNATIGAQARYAECSNAVGNQFSRTGDDARTLLPQLAALADARMKILIWVRSLSLSPPLPFHDALGLGG